jgi:hypothetical protein
MLGKAKIRPTEVAIRQNDVSAGMRRPVIKTATETIMPAAGSMKRFQVDMFQLRHHFVRDAPGSSANDKTCRHRGT